MSPAGLTCRVPHGGRIEGPAGARLGHVGRVWLVHPRVGIVAQGTRSASLEHVTALNLPVNPRRVLVCPWVSFRARTRAQAGESHGPGSL